MATAGSGTMTTTEPLSDDQMRLINAAYQDNVCQEAEVKTSRVAILQPGSPEIAGGVTGYSPGHLIDNVSRELLSQSRKQPWLKAKGVPESELSDVPCMCIAAVMKLPTEFVHWLGKDERKEGDPPFDWKTLDPTDPRVRAGVWKNRGGTYGSRPDQKGRPPVTDHINFLIVVLDIENKRLKTNFIIESFSRTSADAGKQLTTFIQGHGLVNLPPWGQTYWVYTKKEFNQQHNSYYYYKNVAPGPLFNDICPDQEPLIRGMALWLADQQSGKGRQEALLNMSQMDSVEDAHAGTGDGNTVDGTATPSMNPLGGAEDPFSNPPVETKSGF
jgi:hypothetical protein